MNRRLAQLALATTACLLAAVITGCDGSLMIPLPEQPSTPAEEVVGPITLESVEVEEYKGAKLGSVEDFRENSIKGPQEVDLEKYRLKVVGNVEEPLSLTYDEVLERQRYQKLVRMNCVEGWSVDVLWEGVKLTDLLDQAGYDPDSEIVIFRCYDGYSTSLPLDYVRDNDILFAYKMNGIEMPPERGFPFQVVAEDRYGYKWAKWVTEIEVSDDVAFKGYWESRGYRNDAFLPGEEPAE